MKEMKALILTFNFYSTLKDKLSTCIVYYPEKNQPEKKKFICVSMDMHQKVLH